jgi:hypothetical protein
MLIADYIAIGGMILCALLLLWRLGVVRCIRPAQSASSGIFATAEPTDNRGQDQRGPGIGATSGKHSADTEPLRL